MKITGKQAHVLNNLHKIMFAQGSRKERTTLDGEDCHLQLIALTVRNMIAWDRQGRPVKIAEPEGIMAAVGRVWRPVAAE